MEVQQCIKLSRTNDRGLQVMRRTGSFFLRRTTQHIWKEKFLGDRSDSGTPGHISNPAVKAVSADGTWGATPRESRSLPRNFFCFKYHSLTVLVDSWYNCPANVDVSHLFCIMLKTARQGSFRRAFCWKYLVSGRR